MSGAFQELTHKIYDESNVDYCATIICDYALKELKADACGVYLFDRLENIHQIHGIAGDPNLPTTVPQNEPFEGKVACYRKAFECGCLLVKGVATLHTTELSELAKLLVLLFNRKFSADMFLSASRPIDFFQDERSFHSDLRNLTKSASQMPAGALRITQGKGLSTVFFWNNWIDTEFDVSDLDIADLDEFPAMKKCLDERQIVSLEKEDFDCSYMNRPTQRGVRSAILCPINVGTETVGVLSFALPVSYDFIENERKAFLNLANAAGVSLSNFSRTADVQLDLHDDVRVSQMLTAVEVAQAARHSARVDLDTLKTHIGIVRRLVAKGIDRSGKANIEKSVERSEEAIKSCFKSLDDIKTAIRPPSRTAKNTDIQAIFERAKSQIHGRIVKNRVDAQWVGKSVSIECFPDHLLQVFLNLLLNSVDAFSALRRHGNRSVRARLHNYQENAPNVIIRFEDNAGGIDVNALLDASEYADLSVDDLVFAKDITSKGREGSGWGLYVSRKIITDHGGNMRLIEYRGKAVFEINMLKRMR